jgi:high-affinity iron transporter
MLATAMLVFREVLEAALIITIVLGVTRGVMQRTRWVSGGIVLGIACAILVAIFADAIGSAVEGVGQEIFNASVLFLAVVLLGWHNVWMKRHAKELVAQMKHWGNSVKAGEKPLYILAGVIALAVSREGSELVLFLNGVLASGADSLSMLGGGLLGLFAGIALGAIMYFGLVRIPTKHIFSVSGWLILLLAAGMASQGAAFLVQADMLPSMGQAIWNSSSILSEQSLVGQVLHILVGYDERPMGVQILFYLATLAIIGSLTFLLNRDQSTEKKALPNAAIFVLVVSVSTLVIPFAQAGTKVYSPIIEPGEWEFEISSQSSGDEVLIKPEIGYGVTRYWYTEIVGEFEGESLNSGEYEATAWENIFQLTQQGQYWLDAGLYTEYEFAPEGDVTSKFELKLLLEKGIGKIVHTTNLSVERGLGGDGSESEFGYAWRTKYRFSPLFEPAIEIYGELGEAGNLNNVSQQDHRIGPVLMGKYPLSRKSKIGYEAGYLVGLNSNSPNGTIKGSIECELRF